MHVCLQSTLWHQDQSADISKTALYKQAQEVTGRKVFTSNKRDVKAERLFCGLFRISNARAASTSLFFVKIQLGFEMETLKPLLNLTYESLPWVSSCLPKLSPQLVQRSVHLYWKPGYNNRKSLSQLQDKAFSIHMHWKLQQTKLSALIIQLFFQDFFCRNPHQYHKPNRHIFSFPVIRLRMSH